jgi:hypothetical protein
MHPTSMAALERLEKAAWFSRVGVRDTTTAVVLTSWQDAVEHCSTPEWEILCLEAANQYRERIIERSRDRFARWNEIAQEVRETAIPFVLRKLEAIKRELLPAVFENTVNWDIIHFLMEAEFADLVPPGFYTGLAYWYDKGHFPCGWSGEYPKGTLVIY